MGDLSDTGEWSRSIHGDRRRESRRQDDQLSLNRRLTAVEHTQIEMAGDMRRLRDDFAYIRDKLGSLADAQQEQGRKLARAQNFSAGVIAVLGLIITSWTLFGSWFTRQLVGQ